MGAIRSCQIDKNGSEQGQSISNHSLIVLKQNSPHNSCQPRDQIVQLQYIQPVAEEEDESNLQRIIRNYQSFQDSQRRRSHRHYHSGQEKVTQFRNSRFNQDQQAAQFTKEFSNYSIYKSHHNIKNSSAHDQNRSPKSILKKSHSKKVKSCSEISQQKTVHFQTAPSFDQSNNTHFHQQFQ